MSQPVILHHYAASPFAEKVRLALGLKGLDWGSVETAAVPPRPLFDPLTGGYRRVPVLQAGADIYCDTGAILPALERMAPEPTLYPGLSPALASALVFGFERAVWLAAIGVRVHVSGDGPAEFLRDRREDYLYVDISHAAMEPHYRQNAQVLAAWVGTLARTLGDGRAFLCGAQPGAVDLGFFHILWLTRNNAHAARVDADLGLDPILPWYERVAALGHGRPVPMEAEGALEAARAAEPRAIEEVVEAGQAASAGLAPGAAVAVTPDDFARVPVHGRLVALSPDAIVIARESAQTGRLHLHFPRAGFLVSPA